MPFDPSTAVPFDPGSASEFDPTSATPVDPTRSGDLWKPSKSVLEDKSTYWIPPDEYLRMRAPLGDQAKNSPQWRSLEKSLTAGDELIEAPNLVIGKNGKVEEDESDGRHRALWAKEHGIDLIPVKVKGNLPRDDAGLPIEPSGPAGRPHEWSYEPTVSRETKPDALGKLKQLGESIPTSDAKDKDTISLPILGTPSILGTAKAVVKGVPDLMRATSGEIPAFDARGQPQDISPEGASALSLFAGASPAAGSANALARLSTASKPATPLSEAVGAGYRIPPAMARKDAPVGNALQALGGQFKTEQLASLKNQPVTNTLAKQALGVDEKAPLTAKTFQEVRQKAGKAYEDVQASVPELKNDPTFKDTMKNLGGRMTEAAKEFPELLANPELEKLSSVLGDKEAFSSKAAIQLVRKLRSSSGTNFKAFGDPMKQELAHAQREAADAIDSLIERNLERISSEGSDFEARLPTDLVDKYRAARKTLAMSHDIEDATNMATGDVVAADIARMADKGRPFTNQLRTIAKAGQAFGPAMREPTRGASPFTWFDAMLGLGGLHNPLLTAGVLTRPLARQFILSKPYQNMLRDQ